MAVDANEGSGDFVDEADACGEGTVAHMDDIVDRRNRVVVADVGGVGVVAEDTALKTALTCDQARLKSGFEGARATLRG